MDVVTHITYWLVKLTILKNISQMGLLFPIYGKIKFMFQTTNQLIKVPVLITKSTTSSEVPCVGPSSYLVPGGDQTSLCWNLNCLCYSSIYVYIYTPWQFCIGIDWIIICIYIYIYDWPVNDAGSQFSDKPISVIHQIIVHYFLLPSGKLT